MILGVGFEDVAVLPFYGHHYLHRIPVLRTLERWQTKIAMLRNFRPLASFAYTIARKWSRTEARFESKPNIDEAC